MIIDSLWIPDGSTQHIVGVSTPVGDIGLAKCTDIYLTEHAGRIWANCKYENENHASRIISFLFTEQMRLSFKK